MNNVERNQYRKLKLCDAHVHHSNPVPLELTTTKFREIMQYFSLDRIALMATITNSTREDLGTNLKSLYIKDVLNAEKPDSVYFYANVRQALDHRDTADGFLNQVKTLYEMGADGFKFLDGKPNMRKRSQRALDDPIFDKMYAFLEENQNPVTIHIADPVIFRKDISLLSDYEVQHGWFLGDDKTYPTFEQLHEELNGILVKFPKLKLCVAHCGGYLSHDIEALTAFMERWENVSIDLTPGPSIFVDLSQNRDAWRAFFKKYSKRVFFGTDTENMPIKGDDLSKYESPYLVNMVRRALEKSAEESFEIRLGKIVPLDLDDDTLADIYFENHKRLHPHARPLNYYLIAAQASEFLTALKNGTEKHVDEQEHILETENAAMVLEHFLKITKGYML